MGKLNRVLEKLYIFLHLMIQTLAFLHLQSLFV